MAQGYVRAADLPQVIPVFPLPGAILLPRGQLPLNIFEPRYLNMVDDAMAGDRIIGMIQPRQGSRSLPNLSPVGCAGRITSFAETSDGRYLITLTGCARFRLASELPTQTPYRQVRADFAPSKPTSPRLPSTTSASTARACSTPCAPIWKRAAWISTGTPPRPRRRKP